MQSGNESISRAVSDAPLRRLQHKVAIAVYRDRHIGFNKGGGIGLLNHGWAGQTAAERQVFAPINRTRHKPVVYIDGLCPLLRRLEWIGKTNGIFALSASAGGRCSLGAMAVSPAPSGGLSQQLAARRGLDRQVTMREAEDAGMSWC